MSLALDQSRPPGPRRIKTLILSFGHWDDPHGLQAQQMRCSDHVLLGLAPGQLEDCRSSSGLNPLDQQGSSSESNVEVAPMIIGVKGGGVTSLDL